MRILLVDDEEGFLDVMGDLLRVAGHTVVPASDGKIARELIELEKVDLVISDLQMPTLDGVRFHSYVREFTANSGVPFIFVSGFGEPGEGVVTDPARDFFVSKGAPADTILNLVASLSQRGSVPSAGENYGGS